MLLSIKIAKVILFYHSPLRQPTTNFSRPRPDFQVVTAYLVVPITARVTPVNASATKMSSESVVTGVLTITSASVSVVAVTLVIVDLRLFTPAAMMKRDSANVSQV